MRYRICTLAVVVAMERITSDVDSDWHQQLVCREIPKRLYRGLMKSDLTVDLPFLTHLLSPPYNASPDSSKGYGLAAGVYARHLPLIRLLLAFGASSMDWCLMAAITNGDLEVLRLLVERETRVDEGEAVEVEVVERGKKRRRSSELRSELSSKRRKYPDRCVVTEAMLEAAVKAKQWAVVEYLRGKGALIFHLQRT